MGFQFTMEDFFLLLSGVLGGGNLVLEELSFTPFQHAFFYVFSDSMIVTGLGFSASSHQDGSCSPLGERLVGNGTEEKRRNQHCFSFRGPPNRSGWSCEGYKISFII